MTNSPGYKPRVPPYNTMMQFYITTKPDREKALKYFDAMLRAGVAPTAHTYKRLLDAYGTLEPGKYSFRSTLLIRTKVSSFPLLQSTSIPSRMSSLVCWQIPVFITFKAVTGLH